MAVGVCARVTLVWLRFGVVRKSCVWIWVGGFRFTRKLFQFYLHYTIVTHENTRIQLHENGAKCVRRLANCIKIVTQLMILIESNT